MKVNQSQIKRVVQATKQRLDDAIILNLQRIGEQFVAEARDTGSYKDRTGNLRSSVGYTILKDGEVIYGSSFVPVSGPEGNGQAGSTEGQNLIEEIAKRFIRGLVLVCIAGTSYASYVESKGFSVITPAAIGAGKDFLETLERLRRKLKR
jgi:hypothetical protein